MTDMDRLELLAGSVAGLADTVAALGPDVLVSPAYPDEWTVAQVLSHIGSGAVITERNLEAARSGVALAPEVMQDIWDIWNAKPPEDQAADALIADRAALDQLLGTGVDERAALRFSIGPMEIGFDAFVGFRLNEHIVHSWDISVAVDPEATIAPHDAASVLDSIDAIVTFTGRAVDNDRRVEVHTTQPARRLAVTLGPQVSIDEAEPGRTADLEMPTEALVRLVYGRLDPDHTPPVAGSRELLDEVRRAFPGP